MKITIATGVDFHSDRAICDAIKHCVLDLPGIGAGGCYFDLPDYGARKYKELVNPDSQIRPETMGRLFLDYAMAVRALGYQAIRAELLEARIAKSLPRQVVIYTPATQYNIAVCSEFTDEAIRLLGPDRFVTFTQRPEALLEKYLAQIDSSPEGDVDKFRHRQWLANKGGDMAAYRAEVMQDMAFWQDREMARTAKWARQYGKAGTAHECYAIEDIADSRHRLWEALTGGAR